MSPVLEREKMLSNTLKLLALIYVASQIASCSDTTHRIEEDIPDKIEVIHKISLEDLEATFINECEEEFSTQPEVDQCVSEKMENLLNIINNLLDQQSGVESGA